MNVFGLIAAGEAVPPECADSVAELVRWGFVTLDTDHGNRPVALNPQDVAQRRLVDMLRENAARIAHMKQLPEVTDQLTQLYERAQWRAGGGAEYLDDPAVVNARLDDVVGSAQWEILSAQPGGPRDRVQLNRSLARDRAALDRGVSKRTLYRATVRDTPVTAEYARAMSNRVDGKSAEFRTLVGPFERAIIVDRRVAFVSNHLVEGAPEHSAWQITDRAVVAYIAAEFEAKWDRADPWSGQAPGRKPQEWVDTVSGPAGVRTTRRQREIMRELVADRDQKTIAARLGIGLRTVAAEVNELKALLGAGGVAGLAFKWAQVPDRLIDDSDPEDALPAAVQVTATTGAAA